MVNTPVAEGDVYKKSILFLCIGNSCRSQMAEGFGRRYGSDVMEVQSAGLAPAPIVQSLTQKVMLAKNISIVDQFPKDLSSIDLQQVDLIVNMSGVRLPTRLRTELITWPIQDPIGCSEEVYMEVRDKIEDLVMRLILRLRKKEQEPVIAAPRGGFFGRFKRQ